MLLGSLMAAICDESSVESNTWALVIAEWAVFYFCYGSNLLCYRARQAISEMVQE